MFSFALHWCGQFLHVRPSTTSASTLLLMRDVSGLTPDDRRRRRRRRTAHRTYNLMQDLNHGESLILLTYTEFWLSEVREWEAHEKFALYQVGLKPETFCTLLLHDQVSDNLQYQPLKWFELQISSSCTCLRRQHPWRQNHIPLQDY